MAIIRLEDKGFGKMLHEKLSTPGNLALLIGEEKSSGRRTWVIISDPETGPKGVMETPDSFQIDFRFARELYPLVPRRGEPLLPNVSDFSGMAEIKYAIKEGVFGVKDITNRLMRDPYMAPYAAFIAQAHVMHRAQI